MENGKITDTNENLRELQSLFIKNGFSFVWTNKPLLIRDCDYLFFEVIQKHEFKENKPTGKQINVKVLTVGLKSTIHNNGNIFNLKFYDGEVSFKKHNFKKRSYDSVKKYLLKTLNNE